MKFEWGSGVFIEVQLVQLVQLVNHLGIIFEGSGLARYFVSLA